MNIEDFRNFCLSLPGTTEGMKWGHLCFMVEEKIFAIVTLEDENPFCVKCNPEDFDELTTHDVMQQAPHFAKKQWVLVKVLAALPDSKIEQLIKNSRQLVIAKLSKKLQSKYEAN